VFVNRNIKKYLQTKEAQVAEQKKAKEEQDKAKASIVAKAIERIMKEQVISVLRYSQYISAIGRLAILRPFNNILCSNYFN